MYVDNTKTQKSRFYPIDNQIKDLFQRIVNIQLKYDIKNEWIFSNGISHIHAVSISEYMRRACEKIGLSSGSITKLRKTTSSDLQRSGIPKLMVASMLGHTVEVNEKYYTYDNSNMTEKQQYVQNRNMKFCHHNMS